MPEAANNQHPELDGELPREPVKPAVADLSLAKKPRPLFRPRSPAQVRIQLPSGKFLIVWLVAMILLGGGILVFRQKKPAKAPAATTEAPRLSKNIFPLGGLTSMSLAVAAHLAQVKQYEAAKKIFAEVLATEPTNVSVLNNLAYIAGEQDQLPRAAEYLMTAIQVSDHCAECFNNLGSVLSKQGKWSEAKQNFQRALALNPKYVDAQLNLAVLSEQQADWPSAADAYRQAEPLITDPEVKKWVSSRAVWLSEIEQATKRDLAGAASGASK